MGDINNNRQSNFSQSILPGSGRLGILQWEISSTLPECEGQATVQLHCFSLPVDCGRSTIVALNHIKCPAGKGLQQIKGKTTFKQSCFFTRGRRLPLPPFLPMTFSLEPPPPEDAKWAI